MQSAPPRELSLQPQSFHLAGRVWIVLVACLSSLLPHLSWADQPQRNVATAEAILRTSIESARRLNVHGMESVFVQTAAGGMVNMTREVTRTKSGVMLTRWIGKEPQGGLIVFDDGVWSRCYQPKDRLIKVSRSTPHPRDDASAARLLRLIKRNYRIHLEGTAPMAGRRCHILRLTPYHSVSHTVRLWIDQSNGAVLSHQESTARGDTLTVASFNGVDFPKSVDVGKLSRQLPTAREVSFSRSEVITSFAAVRKRIGFEFCPPYSMPAGYEFQNAEILSLNGAATTCLRYTDGVAEITICQSRSEEERPSGYQSTFPMVDDMGNSVVDYRLGPMNFVLVGRCHMNGLIAVTRALDPQKESVYIGYMARTYRQPTAKLTDIRDQGIGLDTMDALLAISAQTRRPMAALIVLGRQGYSWSAIARRYQADVPRIVKHVRSFQCR